MHVYRLLSPAAKGGCCSLRSQQAAAELHRQVGHLLTIRHVPRFDMYYPLLGLSIVSMLLNCVPL